MTTSTSVKTWFARFERAGIHSGVLASIVRAYAAPLSHKVVTILNAGDRARMLLTYCLCEYLDCLVVALQRALMPSAAASTPFIG